MRGCAPSRLAYSSKNVIKGQVRSGIHMAGRVEWLLPGDLLENVLQGGVFLLHFQQYKAAFYRKAKDLFPKIGFGSRIEAKTVVAQGGVPQ